MRRPYLDRAAAGRALAEELGEVGGSVLVLGLARLVALLNARPELVALNAAVRQKELVEGRSGSDCAATPTPSRAWDT